MKLEILGTGCKRCEQLYENALSAASASSDVQVEKVNDVNYFMSKGVFMTPGLVIDGKVISVGKVLPVEEIIQKIDEAKG